MIAVGWRNQFVGEIDQLGGENSGDTQILYNITKPVGVEVEMEKRKGIYHEVGQRLLAPVELVLLMAVVFIADWLLFGIPHNLFAVRPLSLLGLLGVPLHPLVHANLGHLIANAIFLVLLGGLISLRSVKEFAELTIWSALASGTLIWVLGGAGTAHLGASGVVFGYLGFLLLRSVFEKSWARFVPSLVLGLITLVFFGSMVLGVLPLGEAGVSWQGHLGGFIGGVFFARYLGKGATEDVTSAGMDGSDLADWRSDLQATHREARDELEQIEQRIETIKRGK